MVDQHGRGRHSGPRWGTAHGAAWRSRMAVTDARLHRPLHAIALGIEHLLDTAARDSIYVEGITAWTPWVRPGSMVGSISPRNVLRRNSCLCDRVGTGVPGAARARSILGRALRMGTGIY